LRSPWWPPGTGLLTWAHTFIGNEVHTQLAASRSTSPPRTAQLSAEALAQPNNAKLAAQVDTVLKGETLRGLLLNAYAFGTIGTIARIAAIAAFIAAAVMLVLGGLGLMYARCTSPDTDIFISRTARTPEPGSAPIPATLNEGNGLADAAPVSSPS